MSISINGERRELRAGTTVADLIADLELPSEHVAVELNQALLKRALFAETRLRDGDALELVTLVGGG